MPEKKQILNIGAFQYVNVCGPQRCPGEADRFPDLSRDSGWHISSLNRVAALKGREGKGKGGGCGVVQWRRSSAQSLASPAKGSCSQMGQPDVTGCWQMGQEGNSPSLFHS